MGVHCYLTELGALVAMAAKIVAVISTLASLAAAEPGYGGVALHPYGGSSSVYRTTQGLTGYGYGGYGYGGYYGKRSAEPGYYGGASSFVHQSRPYYHGSYGYGINHYGKRSADAGYYGYGYAHGGSSYQQVNRPYSAYGLSVAHPY